MSTKTDTAVEVEFDREFIDKWLHRQKYVWALASLFLATTLVGLWGRGPLSTRTVSAGPGQLGLKYEKFLHYKTPAVLELRLPETAASAGHEIIRLEGALTQQAAFQQIIPQPISADSLPDGIAAEIPVQAGDAAGRVLIVQQPSAVGLLKSKIAVGSSSLEFSQFVLP